MIVKTQAGWDWSGVDEDGACAHPDVQDRPRARVSALPGPDGEPLLVAYEHRPIGFRLARRTD